MFSTPLIQASNAYVLYKSVCYTMHTSMCYTRQCVVYTTDTSYEIRGLQTPCVLYTTDAMYERPCATHVRVLIHATSVCYTCPCVMYTAYTSNPRPTSSVCWSACEPLIPATSPSVVFTTVTSYTRPRNFLVHFFITFVICTFCMHPSQHVRVI